MYSTQYCGGLKNLNSVFVGRGGRGWCFVNLHILTHRALFHII